MSTRLILSAVAGLALASPAFAQVAAPAPAAPPAAAAPTPPAVTEEDVEAAGEVFKADIEALEAELTAAKTAAGADTAKANADADVIEAKYQGRADAFAEVLKAFLDANPAAIPPEAVATILAQVQGAPKQVRDAVMAPTPAAAPAA